MKSETSALNNLFYASGEGNSRSAATRSIPDPPTGSSGWPWIAPVATAAPKAASRPRITVVTPSLNQSAYIERTIRSVLLQNYPDLEYIVIDGGSTDSSPEIIRKYEPWLAAWVSESDRGQSHAINKGFERSTGDILCWLNSDDFLMPGTLDFVSTILASGSDRFALVGDAVRLHADGRTPDFLKGRFAGRERLLQFWTGYHMPQSSIFWRREVFDEVGFLDESEDLVMDFDYWVRIAAKFEFENADRVLSSTTYHPAAKTADGYRSYQRRLRVRSPKYWGSRASPRYWIYMASMTVAGALFPITRGARRAGAATT